MKFGDFNLPVYLLKFFEKKEFAEELLNGKIYMKESGYFRKLEDNYRGDRNDGRRPIDMANQSIFIESLDSERLKLTNIFNFNMGFSGDDKIPIFCASLMDDCILERTSDTSCKFRKEFLDELTKFGRYVSIINYSEFSQKIKLKQQENQDLFMMMSGKVKYSNIMQEHGFEGMSKEYNTSEKYMAFFKKDKSYEWQNEFRLMLLSNNELIDNKNDSYILDIGKFEYANIASTDALATGSIQVDLK